MSMAQQRFELVEFAAAAITLVGNHEGVAYIFFIILHVSKNNFIYINTLNLELPL
jgi:hypothetical protein